MGNCLGKTPNCLGKTPSSSKLPKKKKKWAWRRNRGVCLNGGRSNSGAGNGRTDSNAISETLEISVTVGKEDDVGSAEETPGETPTHGAASDSFPMGKEDNDDIEIVSMYEEPSVAPEDTRDTDIAGEKSTSEDSDKANTDGSEDGRASSASLEFETDSEEQDNTSIDTAAGRSSLEVAKAAYGKISMYAMSRASDAVWAAPRAIADRGVASEGRAVSAASIGSYVTISARSISNGSIRTLSIPRLFFPGSGDSRASGRDVGVAAECRPGSAASIDSSGTMSIGSISNTSDRTVSIPGLGNSRASISIHRLAIPGSGDSHASVSIPRLAIPGSGDSRASVSIPRLAIPGSGDSRASVSIPRLAIPGSGDSRASVSIPRLAIPGSGDSRASGKSGKSGSDGSYGNFFQLALSELDARDKAAGLDAGALTIPRPDNINLGDKLGDGGFGTVWAATDTRTGHSVAVKEINGAFWTAHQAQRAYQEMFYMWQFGCHENILGLLAVYETASSSVWLVCEKMEADLHTVIHRNVLDNRAKQFIAYQICSAVQFLHSGNVIHRDIKPENVLWNSDNTVRICDFGMVRSLTEVGRDDTSTDQQLMTAGMGTLWHAAPEVLMDSNSYTTAVDVWAIGSTLVELLTGIIMADGVDKFQQLGMIFARLPVPTLQDIESLKSPFTTRAFDTAKQTAGIDRTEYGLDKLMIGCPADAIDLCKRMLMVNPSMRCTAEDALSHAYLVSYWDPVNDIIMSDELVPPLTDWKVHSIDEYRAKAAEIMKDIQG